MVAPAFLFIKGNYAFADQNFKPSLLINKTIRKSFFQFLMTMIKQGIIDGKTYNYRRKVVDKFTKLSKKKFFYGMFCS